MWQEVAKMVRHWAIKNILMRLPWLDRHCQLRTVRLLSHLSLATNRYRHLLLVINALRSELSIILVWDHQKWNIIKLPVQKVLQPIRTKRLKYHESIHQPLFRNRVKESVKRAINPGRLPHSIWQWKTQSIQPVTQSFQTSGNSISKACSNPVSQVQALTVSK